MAMLNIPSSNTDPNYRYRMPKLISKVEGRGNGIKTNIMNMADIARALKRPPEYPTKFCGTELGTQSKFDSAEGKSIVNGAHEPRDLQQLIDKFVEKYVLCPNCSLPEIDLVLKKGIVGCHCNACGHSGDLDNAHKLATFMLRNPPKGGDSTMGKLGKVKSEGSKKEKKKSKTSKESGTEEEAGAGGGTAAADGKEKSKKKKKDKTGEEKKEKSSKKSSKKKASAVDGGDDEGEENGGAGEDESAGDENGGSLAAGGGSMTENGVAEKVSKKSSKKLKGSKKSGALAEQLLEKEQLTFDSPEIAEVKSRLIAMWKSTADGVSSAPGASPSSPPTPDTVFTELRVHQVSQDFDSVMRLFVILDVLLTPTWTEETPTSASPVTAERVEEVLPYLKKVIDASMDTPKVCVALENFLERRGGTGAMANFPFILHKLYLAELVDEDDLISRYNPPTSDDSAETLGQSKVSKKSSKKSGSAALPVNKEAAEAVQPFIKWLLEDGDSSSEEEEESENADEAPTVSTSEPKTTASKATDHADDEDDSRSSATGAKPLGSDSTNQDDQDKDEDDDLDIDAI